MSTVSLSKNIRRTPVRTSRNDRTPPTSVRAESTISRRPFPVTALTRGEPQQTPRAGRSAAQPQLSSEMPQRQSWKPPQPRQCWPWPPAEPPLPFPSFQPPVSSGSRASAPELHKGLSVELQGRLMPHPFRNK